jgi:AbrB family looped-hinge helix DNA binding protein
VQHSIFQFFSFHLQMPNGKLNVMKTEMIQIDKAGRVVLPKPLRDQFNLLPGDKLRLSIEGNSFRLEPTEGGGKLVRRGSVLVFTGDFVEQITTAKVEELIAHEREDRISSASGKLNKK